MVGGFRHDGTNHEPSTCRMSGGRRLEHCRIVRSMGAASDILVELCAGDGMAAATNGWGGNGASEIE